MFQENYAFVSITDFSIPVMAELCPWCDLLIFSLLCLALCIFPSRLSVKVLSFGAPLKQHRAHCAFAFPPFELFHCINLSCDHTCDGALLHCLLLVLLFFQCFLLSQSLSLWDGVRFFLLFHLCPCQDFANWHSVNSCDPHKHCWHLSGDYHWSCCPVVSVLGQGHFCTNHCDHSTGCFGFWFCIICSTSLFLMLS
jgi:hypothetical protein